MTGREDRKSKVRADRTHAALLVLIFLAGAALRLHRLGDGEVSAGEVWCLRLATRMPFSEAVQSPVAYPPLYLAVNRLGLGLGESLSWLRFPSVAFGLAVMGAAYALFRRFMDRRAALLAPALLALSPFQIFYSQHYRQYQLVQLEYFFLFSALCFHARRPGWKSAAALGGAAAALFYTYWSGVVLMALAGAAALGAAAWDAAENRNGKTGRLAPARNFLWAAAGLAAGSALALPFLPKFLAIARAAQPYLTLDIPFYKVAALRAWRMTAYFASFIFDEDLVYGPSKGPAFASVIALAGTLSFIAFAMGLRVLWRKKGSMERMAIAYGAVCLVFFLLRSPIATLKSPRYFFYALPFWLLCVCLGVDSIRDKRVRTLIASLLAACAAFGAARYFPERFDNQGWREIARSADREMDEGAAAAFHFGDFTSPALFYLAEERLARPLDLADPARFSIPEKKVPLLTPLWRPGVKEKQALVGWKRLIVVHPVINGREQTAFGLDYYDSICERIKEEERFIPFTETITGRYRILTYRRCQAADRGIF